MTTSVAVLLSNRHSVLYEPYPDELKWYFCFRPPGYKYMPAFRRGQWDGFIKLLKRDRVPTGLFLSLKEQIENELNIKFDIVRMVKKVKFNTEGIKSDREYQNECVEKMVVASKKNAGGLVLNATGTGKTYIAGMYFSRLVGSACFVVDELTLMEQAKKELSTVMDEEVGIVGDSIFNPKRITVATSQTLDLHKEKKQFRKWSDNLQVLMIDEIHQAMSKRNFAVVESIEPPVVFGLTATLELKKEHIRMKAHALTGPTVYDYPLSQGQAEGYLAPSVAIQVQYDGYHAEDSDYHEDYRDMIVEDVLRNELIENLVREAYSRGKYTAVLVERIKHLKNLSEMLKDIPHRVVCGLKKVEDRLASIRHFEKGKVKVVLANKVFKKGINIKKLDVIIDGAGMKNKNDAQQKHGRGVRQADGKVGLIYLDIGDCGNRFEKGAKRRRIALKALGISFKKIDFEFDDEIGSIFDQGEKMLDRAVKKIKDGKNEQQGRLF